MMMLMTTTMMVMKYHFQYKNSKRINDDEVVEDDCCKVLLNATNETTTITNENDFTGVTEEDTMTTPFRQGSSLSVHCDKMCLHDSNWNHHCPTCHCSSSYGPSMKHFVGLSFLWMLIPLLYIAYTVTSESSWNESGSIYMTQGQRQLSIVPATIDQVSLTPKKPKWKWVNYERRRSMRTESIDDSNYNGNSKKTNGISVIMRGSRVDLIHRAIESIVLCNNNYHHRFTPKNSTNSVAHSFLNENNDAAPNNIQEDTINGMAISITNIYVDWINDRSSYDATIENKFNEDTFPDALLDWNFDDVSIYDAEVLQFSSAHTSRRNYRKRRRTKRHHLSDDAILLLDEHVHLRCSDLQLALREWIYDPSRAVGFDTSFLSSNGNNPGSTVKTKTASGLVSDHALLVHRYFYNQFHKRKDPMTKYFHRNYNSDSIECRPFAMSAYILSLNQHNNPPIVIETPITTKTSPTAPTSGLSISLQSKSYRSTLIDCFRNRLYKTATNIRVPTIIGPKRTQ